MGLGKLQKKHCSLSTVMRNHVETSGFSILILFASASVQGVTGSNLNFRFYRSCLEVGMGWISNITPDFKNGKDLIAHLLFNKKVIQSNLFSITQDSGRWLVIYLFIFAYT